MARRVLSPHRPAAAGRSEPDRTDLGRSAPGDRGWSLEARLPARRFARDDAGALLILTGVLLVLGFVIIGTTLVQLNAQEDKATRNQKETLLESVDSLVNGFRTSVASAVELGDTDLDGFRGTSDLNANLLRDTATHTGVYANITLNKDPPLTTYAGPGKCEVYHPTRSGGGIIIGYEKETLRETIVGAVYTMEFTDGRQTVAMDYYVKIHECTGGSLLSFPRDRTEVYGSGPLPFDALKDDDDDRQTVTFVEEGAGDTQYVDQRAPAGTPSVININDPTSTWNSVDKLTADDGQFANRPSPPVLDLLQFNMNPWSDLTDVHHSPGGVAINSFELTVDAKHDVVNSLLGSDDYLQLKAYRPGALLLPYYYHNFTFAANNQEERFELSVPSPSGNPEWTYEEFTDTTFEFSVVANGLKDGDHTFHVDWVSPILTYTGFQGYRMHMEFQWDDIPPIYTDHEMSAAYRLEPTTTAEEFQFQIYNLDTDTWDDFGPTLVDSGAWETWGPVVIPSAYYDDITEGGDNEILVRLVDNLKTDKAIDDRSLLEMDHLVITSTATP